MKNLSTLLLALASVAIAKAQDSTPPALEGAGSLDGTYVGLCFNEAVDPATASDPSHYTLSAGTINSATLQDDGKTVALSVSDLPTNFTVNVTGVTDLSGNAVTASATGRIAGFVAQDLGDVDAPGLALGCGDGAFDVWARGLDIWGFADSGHYTSENRTGDFDVKVQVQSLTAPGNDASAGLMVREDSSPGSRNISVVVYPTQKNWTAAQRVDTDGASSVFPGNWRINWPAGVDYPNVWLRMKRVGNTFSTYGSTNGTEWVQIGNSVVPATPYPQSVMLGFRTTPTEVSAPGTTAHARYRNYGPFAVTGAAINILQQPTNTTVLENSTATFTVNAEATGTSSSNLGYQWQKNGVDLPGATGSSFQTGRLTRLDNNAKYRVIISLPGGVQVTSQDAIVTVQNDTEAPKIVSLASLDGTTIGICFNELLNEAAANDSSHYTLTGGGAVSTATLRPDGMTVVLNVTGITGTNFTLTVNGVSDLAGNALNTTSAGSVLGLTPQDVGTVEGGGSAFSCAPGAIDVQARGADIWGTADSGHLVWQPRTGDFDVRVQVQSFTAPSADANAGLGVRENLDAGSRNVGIVVYANQQNWTATQRADTDGVSTVLGGDWRINWPAGAGYSNVWVRLKRAGETFTTYGSTNGVNWTQIGNSVTPAVPYPASVYVGLRTTPVEVEVAGSTAVVQYRNYGNYSVVGTINIRQQPTNTTSIENTRATFSVEAEVVGSSTGVDYQWQKNGEDIVGANSATYTTGPLALTDTGAKYRVRLSLPGGVPVFSNEAILTVQPDLAAPAVLSAAALAGGAVGVRFSESLDPATANDSSLYSIDGATVDAATLLPDGQTVALQVSGLAANTFQVRVNGVKDVAGNAANSTVTAQTVALTSMDLGNVDAPGLAASTGPGSLDVVARGLDIWGFADSGHFAYEELTGDFDVTVQVENFEAPAQDSNAGLMVREDLGAGSRNVQIVVYANQRNWTGTQRVSTDGVSSVLAGNWRIDWPAGLDYPNAWVRLKRSGETFTTYGSNDGVTWTQIGDAVTPATPYPQTVYVGMRTTPVEVEVPGSSGFAQYRNYGPYIEAVTPELTVSRTDASHISITWPAAGTEGFILESTPSLLPASWTDTGATPVSDGNLRRVTLPIEGSARFFRVRR